jgi:uncharacterized protein YjiS (DUF1127 family)
MTKTPSLIPHQVIADWIQADDVHVLKDAQKPLITAFDDTNLDLFDYSLASRRAHKAEAVAQVFSALGRAIKRLLVATLPSLIGSFRSQLKASHEKRRAIVALSDLSTDMLKDIGITAGDVAATRSGRVTLGELDVFRRAGWPH